MQRRVMLWSAMLHVENMYECMHVCQRMYARTHVVYEHTL